MHANQEYKRMHVIINKYEQKINHLKAGGNYV
jgi:hypothetical protein